MSCKKIKEEIETEGIFRKTGSVKKQRLIQEQLENGGSFDKTHTAIEVANLLKTFFRELPEPLIPPGKIQDELLRCMTQFTVYEEKVEAVLMLMLLLPPINVNTLAYFLQFLEVVIKSSSNNLMTIDNLVRVLTPTIMPVPANGPQIRIGSHFKVVELLIENASLLGVIPQKMCKEIQTVPPITDERKKKRRSGSINRVFNGFRSGFGKIVGAMTSSTENLDETDESIEDDHLATPSAAKTKRRAFDKLNITASSKKKRDLMTLVALQEIDSPPVDLKKSKSRKSCGTNEEKELASPRKRRWSLGKLSRPKILTASVPTQEAQIDIADQSDVDMDAVAYDPLDDVNMEPYSVTISRNEYESFKERLFSIESKIMHEFNITKLDAVKAEMRGGQNDSVLLNGPEKVENKFNQTLLEVEKLEQNRAENFARLCYRDLRQSKEFALVRSPSERKIGSLRRRSRSRLTRNQSWHLGQSSPALNRDESNVITTASFYPKANLKRGRPVQVTVHSTSSRPLPSLPDEPAIEKVIQEKPVIEKVIPEKPLRTKRESTDKSATPLKMSLKPVEVWTPAENFFKDFVEADCQQSHDVCFKTPVRPKRLSAGKSAVDLQRTPMLPPRSTPVNKFTPYSTPNKSLPFNKSLLLTPSLHDKSQGRESIISLRNKNAGMVAQKAKLFNGLSDKDSKEPIVIPRVIVNKNLENVKSIMSYDQSPGKKRNVPSTRSPRRSSRSPGIIKRNQFKATSQSPLLKTIRECSDSQKAKLLKPETLDQVVTQKRKPLSPNNSPNRATRTLKRENAKKFRHTPVKSPRYVRHT